MKLAVFLHREFLFTNAKKKNNNKKKNQLGYLGTQNRNKNEKNIFAMFQIPQYVWSL